MYEGLRFRPLIFNTLSQKNPNNCKTSLLAIFEDIYLHVGVSCAVLYLSPNTAPLFSYNLVLRSLMLQKLSKLTQNSLLLNGTAIQQYPFSIIHCRRK
jgi:hypothetical protein